jgi:hypothetical protein
VFGKTQTITKRKNNLKEEVFHSLATAARHLGILDETAYRNQCLRLEFEHIKKNNPNETVEIIIQKISVKHNLGFETVRHVLYTKDDAIQLTPKQKPKTTRRPDAKRK